MMRTWAIRLSVALTVVAVAATPAVAVTWGTPSPVPGVTDAFQTPDRLRMSGDGTIQLNMTQPARIARRDASGSWSDVPRPADCGAFPGAIDANASGAVACVAVGASSTSVIYRPSPLGAEEVAALPGALAVPAAEAAVTVDDAGDAVAVWITRTGTIGVAYRPADAAAWEVSPSLVDPAAPGAVRTDLRLAVAENGGAVAAWSEATASGVRVVGIRRPSRIVPWHVAETVASPSAPLGERVGGDPVLVGVDANANAVAAWVEVAGRTTRVIRAASLNQALGWSAPVTVGTAEGPVEQSIASLAVAPDGHVIVAWWEGTLHQGSVVTARRIPEGLWAAPQVVARRIPFTRFDPLIDPSGNDRRPRVAIATGGLAVVTWRRDADDRLAPIPQAATGAPGAAWSPPADIGYPNPHTTQFSSDPEPRATDALAIAHDGHAVVVWREAERIVVIETAPPAAPAARELTRIVRANGRSQKAGTATRFQLRLNHAVEHQSVLVERRVGPGWRRTAVVTVTGAIGDVVIRTPTTPGRLTYRVRLLGPGTDPTPAVVTFRTSAAPRQAKPTCLRPIDHAETGGSSLWFLCTTGSGTAARQITPTTGRRSAPITTGADARDIAVATRVWVLSERSLLPIGANTHRPGQVVSLPLDVDEEAIAIAGRGPRLWVLTRRLDDVQRLLTLNASTGAVIRVREIPFLTPDRPAFDLIPRRSGLFIEAVGNGGGDLDTRSRLLTVSAAGAITQSETKFFGDVASGPAGVWGVGTTVIDVSEHAIMTQLDPRRRVYPNARPGARLAVGADVIWGLRDVTIGRSEVSGFDAVTGRLLGRRAVAVTNGQLTIAATARRAWILDTTGGVLIPAG